MRKDDTVKKKAFAVTALPLILAFLPSCGYLAGAALDLINGRSNIQFIAEFYTETNEVDFDPQSPQLEQSFVYGKQQTSFAALYEKDCIVYTVAEPSEDKIPERKTFNEVYSVYYDSWNNYVTKLDVGVLETGDENDIRTISLTIGGYEYSVTFSPCAETPTIVYEKKAIA